MAEPQIVTYQPSFFTERGKAAIHKDQLATVKGPGVVDAGGAGDCGFRSIVVGLIDNVLQNPHDNHQLFYSLMKNYVLKYDFPAPLQGLQTPQDRSLHVIKALSTAYDKQVFIVRMAHLLRQIAVSEIAAKPEKYRGAIINAHEHSSIKDMRQPGTWIDETAIVAVANALQLPIQVKVTKGNKVIFSREGYGPKRGATKVSPIILQLDSGHYRVEVADKTPFNHLASQAVSFDVLAKEDEVADPNMSALRALIKASDEAEIDEYERNVNRLTKWLSYKEIDKNKLLEIYIAGIADSDYLRGRIRHVGLEHGNQSFFEDAIRLRSNGEQNMPPDPDSEMQLINELVHAISRAISIGQLDESILDQIEEQQTSRKIAP